MLRQRTIKTVTKIVQRYLDDLSVFEEFGADEYDNTEYIFERLLELFGKDVEKRGCFRFWLKSFNVFFTFCTGATKIALVFDDLDAVIKIPFNGRYYYSHYDYDDNDLIFHDFSHAGPEGEWDYIQKEIDRYEREDERFKKLFLPNQLCYVTKYDYPIYIQEKAMPANAIYGEKLQTSLGTNKCFTSAGEILNIPSRKVIHDQYWITAVLIHYGTEFFEDFVAYLREHYEENKDLHSGNLGFIGDNALPVILDYAGWYDGSYSS